MNKTAERVFHAFRERFKREPDIIACAPGRVNVIGEHTDYTGGFVLPAAIDREIIFAVSKNGKDTITGWSLDFQEEASTQVGVCDRMHKASWFRYILGVLDELQKIGKNIEGFNFCVTGNVPIGSGLSSSAALEMATCVAMEGLFDFKMEDKEAALLTQRAENNFVGVNCGIMDQYISRVGKADHVVKIDCTDLSIESVKINTPGYSWLIIDSKKRRGLVDSEYNNRRKECEQGLAAAQSVFADRGITGLRDISVDDLAMIEKSCEFTAYKRIKHVVTENDRVLKTVTALEIGDIDTIGTCLYASHTSLRDDFEVSCMELDLLVNILSDVKGVAGARLTGAGFGGCVIALVKDEAVNNVVESIRKKYSSPHLPAGESAEVIPVTISDGARLV